MRIVEKGENNIITKGITFIRSLGLFNILLVIIFLSFTIALITQFTNPQILHDLRQRASGPTISEWSDSFDGTPSSPQRFNPPNYDVQIHTRSMHDFPDAVQTMEAHHGPNCEPPLDSNGNLVTHTISTPEQTVYQCANHFMTALRADDYGLIYVTPNRILDWSDGEAILRWEISTLKSSSRDWWDVWITPYEDNLAAPFSTSGVDLQGEPRNTIHITQEHGNRLCISYTLDFVDYLDNQFESGCIWWVEMTEFLEPSPMVRTTFEARISNNRLSVCMPDHDHCFHDVELPTPLTFTSGVVQFGHHSYTPRKDNSGIENTWHWDELYMSDSLPFSIIKTDKRYYRSGETITFNQSAPANSHLRFTAIGTVELSYDGGSTWVRADKQDASAQSPEDYHPEHASSYWHAIPEGTTSIMYRGSKDGWWDGDYILKDAHVWSLDTTLTNNPVPSPTIAQISQAPTPTTPPIGGDPLPGDEDSAKSVLSLSPAQKTVAVGEAFDVNVVLSPNGNSINAVETTLQFPSSLSITALEISDAFEIEVDSDASNGYFAVATTTPVASTTTVATVTFKAESPAEAPVSFGETEVVSSTTNLNSLESLSNAIFTVLAPTPTPTVKPTSTPTPLPTRTPTPVPPTPTPTPSVTPGDLNSDDVVDVQDLSLFLTYWETKDPRGDINGDRRINIRDVSVMVSNWTF